MSSIVASSPRNLRANCVLTWVYEVNGKLLSEVRCHISQS